jgi:hypothetical protein
LPVSTHNISTIIGISTHNISAIIDISTHNISAIIGISTLASSISLRYIEATMRPR